MSLQYEINRHINPDISEIPGLVRVEKTPIHEMEELTCEKTHSVYPHDDMFGQFITIEEYINAPPEYVFDYLSNPYSLEEWTYSTRNFRPDNNNPEILIGVDALGEDTKIYLKTVTNQSAMTVDYHCAWDQGKDLWMIYLMRVIPSQLVLGKPGCVVTWTNCRHPYYDKNPFPETAPKTRGVWVGDMWHLFYAGHWVEMQNLKAIMEFRHAKG